jgi:phosphoribosylanthranilate isomerase
MPRIRLKICGIASLEEARLAVAAGADAVGLDPAAFASGTVGDHADLAAISLALPPTVTPILLTVALTAGAIAQQVDATAATAVQIVRPLDLSEYPGLKRIIRGRKIIQTIRIEDDGAADLAASYAEFADALLLYPAIADPTELCRQIATASPLPVFLHVTGHRELAALRQDIRPFAFDITAPRKGAKLDEEGLEKLMASLA